MSDTSLFFPEKKGVSLLSKRRQHLSLRMQNSLINHTVRDSLQVIYPQYLTSTLHTISVIGAISSVQYMCMCVHRHTPIYIHAYS